MNGGVKSAIRGELHMDGGTDCHQVRVGARHAHARTSKQEGDQGSMGACQSRHQGPLELLTNAETSLACGESAPLRLKTGTGVAGRATAIGGKG